VFQPGDAIVQRGLHRDGRIYSADSVRVVSDEGRGLLTYDQALDVLVAADRTWHWKDEDEFAERTGHPLFWDQAAASAIRSEANRLIGLAEAAQFPFDGTWCNFRPDPDWQPTELPWWWDQLPPDEPPAWQSANYLG
jgi:hypothetical protein